MDIQTFQICNSGIEETVTYTTDEIDHIYLPLLKRLTELQKKKAGRKEEGSREDEGDREKSSRILVLLAAPPGAGKTTTLQFLETLSRKNPELTPVTGIGMDGFHHYQDYLLTHSVMRDGKEVVMVDIKGAPETFDLSLLTERVRKVAAGETCGWQAYDRLLHNPVENAITVTGDIVILEGNYLLLNWEGWRDLKKYADYTITLTADEDLLRSRLISRKISTGVSPEEAEKFVDYSDMYNVRTCLRDTMKADLTIRVGQGKK